MNLTSFLDKNRSRGSFGNKGKGTLEVLEGDASRIDLSITFTATFEDGFELEDMSGYHFDLDDWKSNNTNEASIEIGSTYDKVTGVASTQVPSYSKMVFDTVDYNQKALYDILGLNVQRNKSKGGDDK